MKLFVNQCLKVEEFPSISQVNIGGSLTLVMWSEMKAKIMCSSRISNVELKSNTVSNAGGLSDNWVINP